VVRAPAPVIPPLLTPLSCARVPSSPCRDAVRLGWPARDADGHRQDSAASLLRASLHSAAPEPSYLRTPPPLAELELIDGRLPPHAAAPEPSRSRYSVVEAVTFLRQSRCSSTSLHLESGSGEISEAPRWRGSMAGAVVREGSGLDLGTLFAVKSAAVAEHVWREESIQFVLHTLLSGAVLGVLLTALLAGSHGSQQGSW
jgi:hypothetical protein